MKKNVYVWENFKKILCISNNSEKNKFSKFKMLKLKFSLWWQKDVKPETLSNCLNVLQFKVGFVVVHSPTFWTNQLLVLCLSCHHVSLIYSTLQHESKHWVASEIIKSHVKCTATYCIDGQLFLSGEQMEPLQQEGKSDNLFRKL